MQLKFFKKEIGMRTLEEIKIKNEHTFNNWGMFDIVYKDVVYPAKWEHRRNIKKLDTTAPDEVYRRVYNYLFDENI